MDKFHAQFFDFRDHRITRGPRIGRQFRVGHQRGLVKVTEIQFFHEPGFFRSVEQQFFHFLDLFALQFSLGNRHGFLSLSVVSS